MKNISKILSVILLVATSITLFVTSLAPQVMAAETGSATETGSGGDITVTVTLEDGKIIDIQTEHGETGGLGEEAINRLVEEAINNQSIELDVVSGASQTSTAFITALTKAIEKAGGDTKNFQGKKEEITEKTEETMETDVVVVGAGGGGFAAAVTAKLEGADVVLLEKLPVVGGNTLISGGEYAAPGNWLQEKEGIEDSPENFMKDVEVAGGDPELIKVVAENATPTAEWLRDEIGVKWLDSLMFFGGHSVKRSLIPEGHTGNELISKYKTKAEELDIPVLTEHDVKELLAEDGKIVGVKVETPTSILTVKADAVVLASGGFGANDEMLHENDPEVDEHVLSTNSPGATGDGITMAKALNADTVGMDKIQLYPICDVETGKLLYVGDTRLV